MARSLPLLVVLAIACGCGRNRSACAELGVSGESCDRIRAMQLPAQLPAARGNRVADLLPAANLGFLIFFDARFSATQSVRCASCHQPEHFFQDGLALPRALGFVPRKTPTLVNAAWMGWQFWDGRADSLWSQPLRPFENPAEMDCTRLEIAHQVQARYRAQYELVFGAMPDLTDPARFPPRGAPGMSAWDSMAAADQDTIQRIVANVGKALEAYLRKLAAGGARLDDFLAGHSSALSPEEKRGLTAFVAAGCGSCHSGPAFSDGRFHNLGVPAAAGQPPDHGRAAALQELRASPFSAYGPYFDGPPPAGEAGLYLADAGNDGAFRTPSLRNLSLNAPYGHNGSFLTLEEVVDFHLRGGGRGQGGFAGEVDPLLQPQAISGEDRTALLAFLRSLKGTYPPLPWADWPQ